MQPTLKVPPKPLKIAKPKNLFQAFHPYTIEFTEERLRIGPLKYTFMLTEFAREARVMGLLADGLISASFDNMELISKCRSYDLIEHPAAGGAFVWEVKTASAGRDACLIPSYMRGTGRKKDLEKIKARQAGYHGYIVVDVAHLPTLKFMGLPMTWLRNTNRDTTKVSRKTIDALFDAEPSLLQDCRSPET